MHFNFDAPVLEAFDELNKLEESLQTYRITYYEDGVKKSFTVQASSKAEAEQIGWSRVDADSLYVSEVVNEAADSAKVAASKKFWAEAKRNRMDEDSFHTAFDDELTELGLMDMFDARGVLENNYGRIKKAAEANPDSWAIKALGKLWALRYSKNREWSVVMNNYFKSEKEEHEAKRKAAEEEEKRKKEEQKKIRAEKLTKYQQLILTYLRKIDADTVDQYEDTIGVPALDGVTVDEVWVHESQWNENLDQEYGIHIEGWNYYYKRKESQINDEAYMLNLLKKGLKEAVGYSYYKEAVAEFKQKIDVLAVKNPKHTVLLLGESGTLYKLWVDAGDFKMSIDGEDTIPAQKIDEPYEVIYAVNQWSNGNFSTRRDTNSGAYYSWNSKYEAMLGRRVPKNFGRQDGYMGTYWETTKLTKAQASGSDFCHAVGIDSWAEYYSHETATD